MSARKPNPQHNKLEGYHSFPGTFGSFEVWWNDGENLLREQGAESLAVGWYWWACYPGCMPDGNPMGPFDSSRAAWLDARDI